MIAITRLLCDTAGPGDHLRYEEKAVPRPVTVWNCTKQCNLRCLHCYASADSRRTPGEMDTVAGKAFIRDLADFGVPVLMFSGGEPLLREDLLELADFAGERGIRLVLLPVGKCPDGYRALKQAPRTSGIDSFSPSQPSVWFQ